MASIVWGRTPSSAADHQNGHIRHPSTPGTHGGKGFVTWGIQKDNLVSFAAVLYVNVVGPNVLGNAARFTLSDFSLAD